MRKAYKKARWKRMASRVEKRGGKVFFVYKTVRHVELPKYPLTFNGLIQALEDIGYKYEDT